MPTFPGGYSAHTVMSAADRLLVADDGTTVKQAAPSVIAQDVYQHHGGAGSTETIDLANGTIHQLDLDANCTLTFTGAVSGAGCSFTLITLQDATGGRTVTWPASVLWPGGTDPVVTATPGGVDVFSFFSVDGGTLWVGMVAGQAFA